MAIPLTKAFRATTIFKAFIINAFLSALIATIIVEVRYAIDSGKGQLYNSIRNTFNSNNLWNDELSKTRFTFVIGFLVTLFLYNILYIFIGYGGGLLTTKTSKQYF